MKELFELNTPDCVSSMGRTPQSGKSVSYFKAKITEQGVETYDNPWNKWGNRGSIGVFKGISNLISDPEDLTASSWTPNAGCTASASEYKLGGLPLTNITTTVNAKAIMQTAGFTGNGVKSISALFRKGTAETDTIIQIKDITAGVDRIELEIDWTTQTVIANSGTLVEDVWFGTDMVRVFSFSTSVTAANTNSVQVKPSNAGTGTVYVTAVQAEDSTYPIPYTSTSRAAGELTFPKSMPNQGTIECWVRPWFDADTTLYHTVFYRGVDGTHRFWLLYSYAINTWQVVWQNGGTARSLYGTTVYTNTTLWNWIHLKVTWNISAGTGTLAVNGVTEDDTWNGALDAFTTPIGVLNIGIRGYDGTCHFDGLITDFLVKDTVDTSTTHYDNNKPYKDKSRILGKNCSFKVR